MPNASAEPIDKPHEAQTRQLSGPLPQAQLTDEELDRLVELHHGRPRVRLVPGNEVPGTRYRIDGWLGDGGTGVVYEATHQDLGRKVAIKVLHTEHSDDPELVRTFRDEARAAIKIASPYIVEVIDFAELPDGRLLYVMERLRGTSLDREVKNAPMDSARLIGILRQACKGLAAAHDAGLVHRDIKPEHLLALHPTEPQANGRRDRIKIMDFGIAAVAGHQSAYTQGTPSYMPPEQVLGVPPVRQNDIYSLGCAAYELLVGRPPFRADNVKDILRAQLKSSPRPPRELIGEDALHPAFEALILKCLAKHRRERYANMRELEAALIEVQLEAGFKTDWDDLPVPDVDPDRKRTLEEGLANLRVVYLAEKRRGWWLPALLGAAITGAVLVTVGVFWNPASPEDVAMAQSRVDVLAAEAKDAAAKARFYYPPVDDRDAPTAYLKVVELESFEGGEEEELGQARASELRKEFADTLEWLGDRLWATNVGRSFAMDYYLQAVIFDDTRTRALERAGIRPEQLPELRRKAQQGDFAENELEVGRMLSVLAEEGLEDYDRSGATPPPLPLVAKNDKSTSRDAAVLPTGVSASRHALFERMLVELGGEPPVPEDVFADAVAKRAEADPPPDESADDDTSDEKTGPRETKPEAPKVVRNPKRARRLARDGYAALKKGRWNEASTMFHASLESDRRNSRALIGLSDLHFEKAEYTKAVEYAGKAVDLAPRHASYLVKYGDALVKVLEYAKARQQYEAAVALGSDTAKRRLQRLKEKVGG